ncbi:hypothetical protein Vretifemale_7346, partial [Volvox reticuliferus]
RLQQQETAYKSPPGVVASATTPRCSGLSPQGHPINSIARPSSASGLSSVTRASPNTGLPKFTPIRKLAIPEARSPSPKVKLPKGDANDDVERRGPPSPDATTNSNSDMPNTGVSSEGSNGSSSSGSTPLPPAAATVMEAAVLPLPATPVASAPTSDAAAPAFNAAAPTFATGQTAFHSCMHADTSTAQSRCTPAKTVTEEPDEEL